MLQQAKDRFLAMLSHELRGPLHAILGWTGLVRRGALDGGMHERALATIERSARIQAELIESLLDVSRITSGKMRLDVRPLDLRPLVRGVIDTVTPMAEEKGVVIAADVGELPAIVRGDAWRLRQVVSNLITNAIKFTPAGGRVTVDVVFDSGAVELRVVDTGCGIARSVLPRVFECYQQAGDRASAGLGLGLFIVRELVEMHGGEVEAESAGPGRGATFTVRLARREEEGPVDPTTLSSMIASVGLEGLRVLLVEDESETRELLEIILRERGAHVVAAADADAALRLFDLHSPDVVVSDIGLPAADGKELIRRVRRDTRGRKVAALAVSAHASAADCSAALAAGFDGYVAKPVSADELVDAINQLVISKD
ncbi:MAG: hybrid sensor histidine kinase/response regulator [Labilithrix sp.]|nr:hybrid sensor histidine kinase/response regulator [Labilithrix sp.]